MLGTVLGLAWKVARITIPIPLALIAAIAIWMQVDKASAVRQAVDAAVEDLVHSAEKEALAARLAEERRLREAGERALAGYTQALAAAEARQAAEGEKREQEIADYEKKLAEAGRACLLDRDDLEWLRQP